MSAGLEIVHTGNLRCKIRNARTGAEACTDAPKDNGGLGEMLSPTDLVGAALGSCIVTMVNLAGKKAGLDLGDVSANVVKEMVSEPLRRIGHLKISVKIPNWNAVPLEDRRKIEQAAMNCPVKNSLHPDIKMVLSFEYPS